jgi:hypothetical protein
MRAVRIRLRHTTILVSDEGFEPPLPAPKAGALPGYANRRKNWCSRSESNRLSPGYKSGASPAMLQERNLVDRERIELSISGCKPDVFPLALTAQFD